MKLEKTAKNEERKSCESRKAHSYIIVNLIWDGRDAPPTKPHLKKYPFHA